MAEGEKAGPKSHENTEESDCIDLHPEMNGKLIQSLESEIIKLRIIIRTTQS